MRRFLRLWARIDWARIIWARIVWAPFVWATAAGVVAQAPGADPTLPPAGLKVVVLDVGQASCTIILGPTGTAMVVDGGGNGDGRGKVIPALRALGVQMSSSSWPPTTTRTTSADSTK